MPLGKNSYRPDRHEQRAAFERNKKILLKTKGDCAICGRPIDFSLKFPDPGSPCVDHIIPIDRGGHPSDMSNLQLAHLSCNRAKSDRIMATKAPEVVSNRILPQSRDWMKYKATVSE